MLDGRLSEKAGGEKEKGDQQKTGCVFHGRIKVNKIGEEKREGSSYLGRRKTLQSKNIDGSHRSITVPSPLKKPVRNNHSPPTVSRSETPS